MNNLVKYLVFALSISFPLARSATAAGNDNATGVAGQFNGSITTGGSYDPYTGNASRAVEDLSVAGSIGAYPLKWSRVLNTRKPTDPFPMGQGGWTHSYYWAMTTRGSTNPEHWNEENQDEVYEGADAAVIYPDGRVVDFYGEPTQGYTGSAEPDTSVVLVPNQGGYDLIFTDGGMVLFRPASYVINGFVRSGLYAHSIVDPYGQTTAFTRDGAGRLIRVTEPGGRYLQINYSPRWVNFGGFSGNIYVITSVQGFHFEGQVTATETVNYEYTDPFNSGNRPYLTQVNYADGEHAFYSYQTANTTGPGLISTCEDVRFTGPMSRIKYEFLTYAQNSNAPPDWGQLRAERNLTTNQIVSQVTYSPENQPGVSYRTETRGDGATRTFNYDTEGSGDLRSYTDFRNNPSWISAKTLIPGTALLNRVFTDGRGNATTTLRHFQLGAVKTIILPPDENNVQPTVQYTYTSATAPRYLASLTDERGHTTSYSRENGNNRVWKINYPDGGEEQFTYNGFGQIRTHTMTKGGTETFEYDSRGRKTAYFPPATCDAIICSDPNPWDHKTIYNYYESGPNTDRLLNVIDPRGNATWYEYNLRGQVTKVIHQDGSYIQNGYYPNGTLAWTADENHPNAAWNENERTRYTYDEYKRVLTVTNPLNETTSNNYAQDWVNPLVHTTSSIRRTTLPSGKAVDYAYDANWRKILQASAPGTPEEDCTWFEYDAVGNLAWTTDPRGKTTQFGYDNRNRQTTVINARNETTTTTYDRAGNKTSVTRPGNQPFRYTIYDEMNRLFEQVDERGVYSWTGHDHAGNLTDRWDGNDKHYVYAYDDQNRLTKTTYPGATSTTEPTTEERRYDWAGNVVWNKNRSGAQQTFAAYDNRNRPTSFSWGDGTQGQSFSYDFASRVTELHNANADIINIYNDANRKTSETTTIKSYGLWATRSTVYRYDEDGNRKRLIYPQGYEFIYDYTQRGQLDNIKLDPAIFGGYYNTPVVRYSYDLSGNRTTRTVLSGAYADYTIDDVNRISGQTNHFANWQSARFDYGFDPMGRRRYEQRDWWRADGFQYDAVDQVTGYQRDGTLNSDGTVSANWWNNTGLRYDHNGNRIEVTGSGANFYATNDLNQYTGDANTGGMGYDLKGNLTSAAGWVYGYDAQNRLTTMERPGMTITMTYDPLNRVITRNVNGAVTQNVWDGWNLIEEHRPDWSIQRCYLQGANQNEMVAAFDGNVYTNHWFWQDGRGNTSHITGDPGNLLERYTYDLSGAPKFYDEWGGERSASAYDTRLLFAGSQYLPDTGLYDMRNRFYHIALNRFLQTDPIGFKGDPLNLYRYCGNDPGDRSDPLGLISWEAGAGLTSWGNGIWTSADGVTNQDVVGLYRNIRDALSSWFSGSQEAASRSEQGRLKVESANVAISSKTQSYKDANDTRAGYTPNPIGTSRTSFQESGGKLALTYHLHISIRLNYSRGTLNRVFAKLREPDHAGDFYAARPRFEAAAQTLVGQRFRSGAAAEAGLRTAVDPVVQRVFDESWRDRDLSGDHNPRDIFGDNHLLGPNE